MNISNYNKAEVLAALYNASKHQGMGFLQAKEGLMTVNEAENLLKERTYFDYLHGKVMKINLSGDELMTHLYNRDNGEGAAEYVISMLQKI